RRQRGPLPRHARVHAEPLQRPGRGQLGQPRRLREGCRARRDALVADAGGPVFDQYPDTRSQVYKGADGEAPSSNAAVDATAGQVLRYNGEIAVTYFFSTSGGHTEDVQIVFYGAKPEPYLVGVKDPYDNISPKHRWQIRTTTARLQR